MNSVELPNETMLRVQIESLIAGIDGTETIMTTESATVGNLIAGFVFERRLRPEVVSEFALQDAKGNILKHHRTVGSYGLKDGDKLYLMKSIPECADVIDKKNHSQVLLGCRNWFALAAAVFIIALIGFGVVIYMYAKPGTYPFDYVVVLDAGSTHTNLFVYKWVGNKIRGTGVVEQLATTKCEGLGLSNYDDPEKAARSLHNCLSFASDQIPPDALEETEVFVGATAGMRILAETNATEARDILENVRIEIEKNFMFRFSSENVRIITGQEEGMAGWITANYLAETIPYKNYYPGFTYGALDLGGASAQITFETDDPHANATVTVKYFGQEYDLYSQSYLCYGLREAERRLKAFLVVEQQNSSTFENPCMPLGNSTVEPFDSVFGQYCTKDIKPTITFSNLTFYGTSNSSQCTEKISNLFNISTCSFPNNECSFNGLYEPPLDGKFMAFSGFYSVVEFLNLTHGKDGVVPLDLFRQTTATFCGKNWTEINTLNASDPHSPFLTMYCFDAHFVDALLTVGYGFNTTNFERVQFTKDIGGTAVGWTLGFALNSTNTRDSEKPQYSISSAVFIPLMILFAILLIFAIAFSLRAIKVARRYRDYESISTYGAI